MNTCAGNCGNAKRSVMIYACSGAANVAEIADKVARQLARDGAGSMFCLAGLGAEVPEMIATARKADITLVLDGCPVDCARKIMEKAQLPNTHIIRVTDLGIAKAKGVAVTDEQVDLVYGEARRLLAVA